MDLETQSKAKEKVEAMNQLVAYPDWILNKTSLEDYYSEVYNDVPMCSCF